MTEKSVFREAWSPELTLELFPVSCFWCRSFVPHQKWNLMLLAHQNTGKENCYRKIFLLHLSAHWGDLIEQIKKICHIHFKAKYTGFLTLARLLSSWECYCCWLQVIIVAVNCKLFKENKEIKLLKSSHLLLQWYNATSLGVLPYTSKVFCPKYYGPVI